MKKKESAQLCFPYSNTTCTHFHFLTLFLHGILFFRKAKLFFPNSHSVLLKKQSCENNLYRWLVERGESVNPLVPEIHCSERQDKLISFTDLQIFVFIWSRWTRFCDSLTWRGLDIFHTILHGYLLAGCKITKKWQRKSAKWKRYQTPQMDQKKKIPQLEKKDEGKRRILKIGRTASGLSDRLVSIVSVCAHCNVKVDWKHAPISRNR